MHTDWSERELEFTRRIFGASATQTMQQSPGESAMIVDAYCRRKRRESEAVVSAAISGCGAEAGKHSSLPRVADVPLTNQKMKSILAVNDGIILPLQPRSEMRSKRKDMSKNIITVDETGLYEGQIVQECPTKRHARPRQSKKCKEMVEELSDSEDSSRHHLGSSQSCGLAKQKVSCNNATTQQEGKLDSKTFQCYLENLWQSFSKKKINSFTHLDSLWYSMYSTPATKERVLKWIKKKNIFSKKYVFVPIVQWCHWSLLIFCNFGESLELKSTTKTPCMLLLDSLQMTDPKRLEPGIRKFVLDIYRTEERGENEKKLYKMPLLVPKVPQQRNGEECGFFVLYFINLFVESAPDNFSRSRSEGYPYFMKKDWFTHERLDCFCRTLNSSGN